MALHGGDIYKFAKKIGCSTNEIIDFSSNIHFNQAVNWRELTLNLQPYSDPDYTELRYAIKQRYFLADDVELELYNGASAAIFALLRFLASDCVVFYAPIFSEYEKVISYFECDVQLINRFNEDLIFKPVPKNSTIIFVNPSTPDGKIYDMYELFKHWKNKNCKIIVDESFLDFCYFPSMLEVIADYDQLFIVRSLCKFYGCAGVRVGFIAAQKKTIQALKGYEPMWKISTFDNIYMQAALKNKKFIEQTRNDISHLRPKLERVLIKSNLFEKIYDGSTNFILARLENKNLNLQNELEQFKILIRECDSFDFLNSKDIRFAVKSKADIEKLAYALESIYV